jgi:GT2 family glycosyltransferase
MTKINSNVEVSIVIVNYNGAPYINRCIDALLNSKTKDQQEIIVIDNNSQDDSLLKLQAYQNKIILIKNKINTGFAHANNQGFKKANGAYIFILNNDAFVEPDTISKLLQLYKKLPNIGALAPRLLNADHSIQYSGSILGHYQYKTKIPRQVKFIPGAAIFTAQTIIKQINGFDENFFFYNEDIDFCKQIIKRGYALYYDPHNAIIHYQGAATKTRKPASIIEGYRGGLYFCFKHYPLAIYHLYRILLLLDLIPKMVYYSILSVIDKEKINIAKAYFEIIKLNITNNIFLSEIRKNEKKH